MKIKQKLSNYSVDKKNINRETKFCGTQTKFLWRKQKRDNNFLDKIKKL
jgi:hypothetical protein